MVLDVMRDRADLDMQPVAIVKSMATYYTLDSFKIMEEISDGIIWSIRDPMIQISSLLTRTANDLIAGGEDLLREEEIESFIPDAVSFLENSDLSRAFSRTGWESIGKLYDCSVSNNQTVIDGGEFVAHPSSVLELLCDRVNLEFSSSMVKGWQKDIIHLNSPGNSRLSFEDNAWTRDAMKSDGIFTSKREALDRVSLPQSLLDHLDRVAVPVYEKMKQAQPNGD